MPVTQAQRTKLAALLLRIEAATAEVGKKTELAQFLGVSPQHLNHWLSGARAPGGEVTLQLLEWVGEEEAKQKNSGTASTAPERKARRRSSHETKPTSGRRKK